MDSKDLIYKKPIFRWAGSKKKVLHELEYYWSSKYKRYIEPFAGSAQLFFAIQPPKAIINDINVDLIETYITISKYPKAVFDIYSSFPRNETFYYELRSKYPKIRGKKEKAAVFFYLNRNCFNGLFRVNKKGFFNVPFSKNTGIKEWSLEDWENSASTLKKASFHCSDFESLIRNNVKAGDFVYIDPPYAIENRRIFTQYSTSSFGTSDIIRLQKVLKFINNKKAKFVLSYALCDEANVLSQGWNKRTIQINRNISGFSKFRRKEKELIITNISK